LDLRQQIDMRVLPDGGLTATSVTLQFLIQVAYQVQSNQVSAGPAWLATERFDILAKPAEGVKPENAKRDFLPMLQSLLADRFQLIVHPATKELPVYELRLAKSGGKLGPGLHPLEPADCPAGPPPAGTLTAPCHGFLVFANQLSGHRVALSQFGSPLANILGRSVLDKTGIPGEFDLDLTWTPDPALPGRGETVPLPPDASAPSFFTAVQEQLGLKLDSAKGSVEILAVDRAEKPGEN
jgi:uncharacterized protein (TIGR03435 family)